ncbi:MAG: CarD family transcriptional regulator [Oscillospiraceae bacterium]|nr:CarD family transcriptional regulator [Oscillospiraceae bacterium]
MFKIGDVVVYSTAGVCRIEEISPKTFGALKTDYYVLRPLIQTASTVFVPVENERLTCKMHPILSQEEFLKVFCAAKKREPIRPDSESERREKFTEILESGNRETLILMVYDLNNLKTEQQQCGRRLHLADERLLNSAQNLLFEEISYVFKIDIAEASSFLKKQFA